MDSEGTVIWYRADTSRGVVRLDGGKQYMFTRVQDLDEIQPLLRVRVLHVEKGPGGAVVTGFKDGRTEFGAPLPPLRKRVLKPPSTPGTRNPDAPPNGAKVVHNNYGAGTIIGATAKMVRVRFDSDQKERSVRLTSLVDPTPAEDDDDDDDADDGPDEVVTPGDSADDDDDDDDDKADKADKADKDSAQS